MSRKRRNQQGGARPEQATVSMRLVAHNEISTVIDELKARNLNMAQLTREARRLRRKGPEVWRVLERKLRGDDLDLAYFAMILASRIDEDQAVEFLYDVLADAGMRDLIKMHAAFLLAELGDPVDLEYLAQVVDDPEKAMAETMEEMLNMLEDPSGLELFLSSLQEVPQEAKIGAIQILGARRDHRTIDALSLFLEEQDPELVAAAVEALGNIPSERVLRRLERISEETPDGETRRLARKTLMKLRTAQVEENLQPAPEPEGRFVSGHLSSADGGGSWFVVVVVEYPRYGPRFGAFCLNEVRGLVDCFGGEFSPAVLDYLQNPSPAGVIRLVEAPAWYCLEAVRRAEERTEHEALPREYFAYRKILDCLYDQAENERERKRFETIWNSATTAPPEDLEASVEFLDRPDFQSWLWNPEALEETINEVIDCFTEYGSRTHPDYAAEVEEIVTEVLEEQFDDHASETLQQRLHHQAFVAWCAGEARGAHLLAAVAHSLAAATPAPAEHPFLRAYVRRTVESPILLHESLPPRWWERDWAPPSTWRGWWSRRRRRR